jgi:catechol 2,3-dioxygenase-like lactoylglutathione lyase family enzyme
MDVFADQGKVRAIYHVSLGVTDMERARQFYSAVLSPLGYKLLYEVKAGEKITSLGWGLHFPELWTNTPVNGAQPHPGNGIHVAFHAPTAKAVDEFHRAALSAGGTDNGPPGYRSDYDPGYYGAFVLDPEGNRLEAMWFDHGKSDGK